MMRILNYNDLCDFLTAEKIEYKLDEPMKNHTSFKIGGNADVFVSVKSEDELSTLIKYVTSQNIPYFILGKGSNILVSDGGIEGVVISLLNMDGIVVEGECITAFAGASLARVCTEALNNCLSGLEFAYGIPGSLGGALFMNAGAYGGEMSQVVSTATYITEKGEKGEIELKNMKLGYRTSIFKNSNMIITKVVLSLKKGDKSKINDCMNNLLQRRKDKQPLEYPSAGSTFKRPEGYFAGALIEQNGLKGYTVGGAKVSEKHAGFVINYNNATCCDVRTLMKNVCDKILEKDNVILVPEIIFVGRED